MFAWTSVSRFHPVHAPSRHRVREDHLPFLQTSDCLCVLWLAAPNAIIQQVPSQRLNSASSQLFLYLNATTTKNVSLLRSPTETIGRLLSPFIFRWSLLAPLCWPWRPLPKRVYRSGIVSQCGREKENRHEVFFTPGGKTERGGRRGKKSRKVSTFYFFSDLFVLCVCYLSVWLNLQVITA